MSLQPQEIGPVPAETAHVAHAAFPQGTVVIHRRDMVGLLFIRMWTSLHSSRPVGSRWRRRGGWWWSSAGVRGGAL